MARHSSPPIDFQIRFSDFNLSLLSKKFSSRNITYEQYPSTWTIFAKTDQVGFCWSPSILIGIVGYQHTLDFALYCTLALDFFLAIDIYVRFALAFVITLALDLALALGICAAFSCGLGV